MSTLASSFLIRSSSYLQVTRTSITSRTSSKFGQIGPRTAELAALERMKKIPTIFHLILFILAGNEDMHRSLDEFEIQSDPTMCFTRPRYQVSVYRTIGPLVMKI